MQGIEYLKQSTSTFFTAFRKNLEAGKCVSCGEVELSECDKIFGMCNVCKKTVDIPQVEFDHIWFSNNLNK